MREQRDAERLGLSAVRGEVLVPQSLLLTQMSRRGMEVEAAFPLLLDALHEFRLTLDDHRLVIKGRVVHSRIRDVDRDVVTYVSGIEFVELPETAVAAIGAFLTGVARVRAALQQGTDSRDAV